MQKKLKDAAEGTVLDIPSELNGVDVSMLTASEITRLRGYIRRWPHEVHALNQNPAARPLTSSKGKLSTFVKSMGILWMHDEGRMMTTYELLSAMGYPVFETAQEVAGATCCFS